MALLTFVVVALLITSAWLGGSALLAALLPFAGTVTCLLLAWYVTAILAVPVRTRQPDIQDDAAGAGLVFLALPSAGLVFVLTAIGAGLGAGIN